MSKTLITLALLATTLASADDSRMVQDCQAQAEAAEAIDETKFVSTLYACFEASGATWAQGLGSGDGETYGGFTDSDVGCTDNCLEPAKQ